MRTIYIDSDYKCHVTGDDTRKAVETDAFDGKCDAFIEGYCFVPAGESWTRPDGTVFRGEMAAPWQDYSALDAAQRSFEQEMIAAYEALINELYEEVL